MNTPEDNPFQSPSIEASYQSVVPGEVYPKLLKNFHDQALALGVCWILLGCLGIGITSYALIGGSFRTPMKFILNAMRLVSLGWLIFGVLTCMKKIWAMRLALGLTYVSAIMQLLSVSICGSFLLIVVILQAHRVLNWARKLQQAGLPLTSRP